MTLNIDDVRACEQYLLRFGIKLEPYTYDISHSAREPFTVFRLCSTIETVIDGDGVRPKIIALANQDTLLDVVDAFCSGYEYACKMAQN